MKKVLLALAVVATVACFTSCKKTCTCTTYAGGEVITTTEVNLEKGKCADMNTIMEMPGVGKTGVECK